MISSQLLDFCYTDRQREVISAYIKYGSVCKAAKELKVSGPTVVESVKRVKRAAALKGWSPEHDMTHATSPVHVAKGTSTLYNEDGKPILQWVKTSLQHDAAMQVMREAMEELKADIKPAKPVKLTNKRQLDELLTLYPLTDIHFGMRAWAEETGANWDLEIAEQTVLAAVSHLIASSPDSATGFFLQLGDALHYDGMLPVTPTNNHVLDADSRLQKVVRTVIRVFRTTISMLLAKHEKVIMLHAQGNHDLSSSVWLQEVFAALYENEPRIEVIVSPNPYYARVHGEILLGAHHGHKRSKPNDLIAVFNDQFRHLAGDTKRTYIHTGHLHSDMLDGFGSTRVERHETIAAPDAHATHGGWRSTRSMKAITYSRQAEVSRTLFYPWMSE